jgi:uncharacterized protein YdeI (YjbR/CyaY-like superfamily)
MKTLFVSTRGAWRAWLARNHKSAAEVWLVYPKKASGKKRIPYHDAVEEALCYGWIDSTVRSRDSLSYMQRFSPRRKGSTLSEMNRQRVRSLIKRGKMSKAGLAALPQASKPQGRFQVPAPLLKALKANKEAWRQYQKLPLAYRRIRIAYIESQKRHSQEAYRKALAHFIARTSRGKRFGFVKEMS